MSSNGQFDYDVAIVGGGPGGSTAATILRKYNPEISVLVIEKERFPREHVGESQLPICTHVLNEMGAWDKVEAANFPIKLGASYTWGKDTESWDFNLYPPEQFTNESRPAKFVGQRQQTAFQVERSIYDQILLDHAAELGAEVRQETKVNEILRSEGGTGDRIEGFVLSDGSTVRAKHYIDASGNVGIIRRAMGVATEKPLELRNVAFWDYWENTEWAVKIGIGGTRVQVRSVPYGWLWFIPLGPTRSSVGLVCPAEYYKKSGLTPEELYDKAVREEPLLAKHTKSGTREGEVRTTSDWSFLADRLTGENWFLCGESAGFADPILAAGMSLTHESAREVAYTILETERQAHDPDWLKKQYNDRTRASIWQHIRFALYWYSANGQFTDLQEYCQKIASDAGLDMTLEEAWRWLAQGGFVNYGRTGPAFGSYDLASAKAIVELFQGEGEVCDYSFDNHNVFHLNIEGASETERSEYREGRIERVPCLEREGKLLPLSGAFLTVKQSLANTSYMVPMFEMWKRVAAQRLHPSAHGQMLTLLLQTLDAMVIDGWVVASKDASRPMLDRDKENPFKKSMKEGRTVSVGAGGGGSEGDGSAGSGRGAGGVRGPGGGPARRPVRSGTGASKATKQRRFKKRK